MRQPSSLYRRHRFPGEVISHAVWLYYRFLLSYRDVEELLAERGVTISYETIRVAGHCHVNDAGTSGGRAQACVGQLVNRYTAASPVTARQVVKRACSRWW
jgi:hypothetical protein